LHRSDAAAFLSSVEVFLLRLLVGLIAAYGTIVTVLAVRETSLVYPGMGRTFRALPAPETGVPWDTVRVKAADSVPVLLMVSRVDTVSARPWALYLHGNLGLLGGRGNIARYRLLREAGFNVLAVEYRGFGLSAKAGRPSESGIYKDASAGWVWLTGPQAVSPARVVIYGMSLGGGAATYLTLANPPAALVTEGTATSLPDVGAKRYPWVPVRLIMRNRFPNLARAPAIAVPWVIFHSRNDVTVPFSHGEALSRAAPTAQFVPLVADHEGGVAVARAVSLPILQDLARKVWAPAEVP
jgi:pimeloyl-ACP methyl ester carboxylesterase